MAWSPGKSKEWQRRDQKRQRFASKWPCLWEEEEKEEGKEGRRRGKGREDRNQWGPGLTEVEEAMQARKWFAFCQPAAACAHPYPQLVMPAQPLLGVMKPTLAG